MNASLKAVEGLTIGGAALLTGALFLSTWTSAIQVADTLSLHMDFGHPGG
ncbi:MAG: hypothetical protein JRH20_32890 [Deltaproteobacteria bacterium]|nr:hypothetical protein [Deltaproteobacteria bacterium]